MSTLLTQKQLHKLFLEDVGDYAQCVEDSGRKPLCLRLDYPYNRDLKAYIFNCTAPPGGRSIDEFKVQMILDGQKRGSRGKLDTSDGKTSLIVGYANPFFDQSSGLWVLFELDKHMEFAYTPWAGSSFDEFYRLLHSDLSCDSANAQRIASIFYPAESIEEMLEDPEEEMLLSDADELMEDRLIDEYGREEYSKQVRQCVDSLTDREREVLYLRYGLGGNSGKSLQEVGDYYGLTRERVRQIEVKAERHLRGFPALFD